MINLVPTILAALLLAVMVTPVFAQAAVQEPGLAAFNHPNADVLHAGPGGYRAFGSANAYYNEMVPAPRLQRHSRHHRTAR